MRPANRDIPRSADGSLPLKTLLAEWPEGAEGPTDFWLSNLPADTPLPTLAHLAKIRWRVERDYRELETALGLSHFEGRSYAGWNRHVTLVCLAQAFCLLRLDPKPRPRRRRDAVRGAARAPAPPRRPGRRVPDLPPANRCT